MVTTLQRNHVIVHSGSLDFGIVLKVELFRLKVGFGERACGEVERYRSPCVGAESEIREDVLFLLLGEVPEDCYAIREDEELAKGEGIGRDAIRMVVVP
jgi:hypothetical protein